MNNHVCPWWLAYTFDNPLRSFLHKPEKMFSSYVREGMTVADIGCGMGYFSIGLAKIVKDKGRVIAVDIQKQMLDRLEKRARKAGVSEIISSRQCTEDSIEISEPLDFALAFWMLHETKDKNIFLEQIYRILKPGGLFLVAEPRMHVSSAQLRQEIEIAVQTGFSIKETPQIALSHSVVLGK